MRTLLLVAAALAATGPRPASSSVLVADNAMTRMVELNAGAPFCVLYHDRGTIQRMVLGSDPKKVRQISNNLVADLEETCKASRQKGKVHVYCYYLVVMQGGFALSSSSACFSFRCRYNMHNARMFSFLFLSFSLRKITAFTVEIKKRKKFLICSKMNNLSNSNLTQIYQFEFT